MNEREQTHLTSAEIQAKQASLERHMAMHAISVFQDFIEQHDIDQDADLTPEQAKEWDKIRTNIDAHLSTRRAALSQLIPTDTIAPFA